MRRLLYLWQQLVLRDLRARYKQTVLGGLWSLGRPLVELGVYTAIFGSVLGAPSDDAPYPLFAYIGVVLWTFVAGSVTRGTASVTGHAALVSSIPFPKIAAPLAAIGTAAFDALLSGVLLVAALLYLDSPITAHLLWLLPIAAILITLITGLTLILAAVNVFYRDVHHLVGLGVSLWLFLTPVVYAASAVPERYRPWYDLNPLVGILESARLILIQGHAPDWEALAYSAAVGVPLLLVATALFRKVEPYFAETV